MAAAPELGLSTIGQIGITVADIARAVQFYRETLGLRFLLQAPNMAFFDCDGVRLLLGLPAGDHPAAGAILYFKVRDMESAVAQLKARGVVFERDPHLVARLPDHDLWMASFRDPDGNSLALLCEKRR